MNYAPGSSIMPFDETSRISRMATSIAHSVESYFESSESTLFDRFFLIIDELGRCSPPNTILTFIQFVILGYQYYISFYFSFLHGKWDFTKYPDKVLRYLTYPVDFGLGDSKIFTIGIVSYILLILSLLIIIYLVSIYIYFHQNKMFPRHNAHITRFVFSLLIPILLTPSCYNIGFSFNSIFANEFETLIYYNDTSSNSTIESIPSFFHIETIGTNKKALFILSTVFGLILYSILTVLFYIDVKFRSSTPYLENTALSMWDGRSLFEGVFGATLSILSSALIERLPEWTNYFLLVCAVFYNVYVLVGMFLFPMVKHWMNVSVSSFVSGAIIASLFQLFPIDSVYRLFIPLGCLFIFFPFYWFLFRRMRRKFAHLEFDEADLSTEGKCLRYLRLAIADRCADFVTFKWVRKMNQVDTTNVICQVAQMISFFPTESQSLTFYISVLSKRPSLSLHQRFHLFQLRRVHVLRQSNTSKQLNEDLEEISKATNQSIASFSQFLIRTIDERQELSLDSLAGLARLNRTTSSLCHEAMARYPNNSRLLFIFARYVIECQADFKGGISLYQEGQLIDRGKRPVIDFAFRAMVNLFPNYLWKRILDSRGRSIIRRRRQKGDSSMSSDSQEKNLASDTDVESNEKIASSVLENPRLRLSLKKAVNNMHSTGIWIITLSLVILIILSFVTCFIVIGVASSFLDDRSINYQNIAQIASVRKSVDLSLFRMAKLWSSSLKLSPKQSDVTAALGTNVTLDEFNNISADPTTALVTDIFDSIQAIEKLGKLLAAIKYQDSMDLSDKSSTDFVQFNNISFCSAKMRSVFQSSTSIRYFSLYLLSQVVSVTKFPGIYSNPWEWKEDESICEVILNMQNIIDALNAQSTVLVNQEEDYSNSKEKQILMFFCVIIPIAFAVYFVPFIAGYVKMNSEFKQIFDILNLLPIKIYKEASKPIALFQSDSEQSQEGISHVAIKGCQKIGIVIPAVLSSIIIASSLIGIFFLISDVNTKFFSIVKWLEIGSRRTPLLIETVTNGILAGIFGYIGPTEYTNHVVHLDNVFDYSQRLLYQHKTLIWGSDDSTSCNNFTKRLDDLHFSNTCVIDMQGDSLHSVYRCMSLDQQIMTFNKFAKDAYLTMIYAQTNSSSDNTNDETNDAFLNILNGYEMINLHFLGITYLLPKLEEAQNILNELIDLKIDQLSHYSIIISLCTLGAEIILFIIEIFIINILKDEYNIVRILIARLPPLSVVGNQSIVELITGNYDDSKSKNNSPIETHIRYCSNPIIAFNKMCKIQLVNRATTEVFGFTKEQLFHTHISTVIEKENTLQIQEKCSRNYEHKDDQKRRKKLNKKREIIPEREDKTKLISKPNNANISILLNDNDNIDFNNKNNETNTKNDENKDQIIDLYNNPFSMTIIGMKDDGTKIILQSVLTYLPPPDDVYVLIMKDETQIYVNKNEIVSSKLKASNIKMNVLPPEISQNDNINENISFSLKLVSVITVRIMNFNESVLNFTSIQAIRNMAELFTIFDEQLVKYQNLTKSLVISEAYQAIGGLFNSNSIKKITSKDDNEENENNFDASTSMAEGNKLSKANNSESSKSIKANKNDNTESTKSLKLSKSGKTESTKSLKSGNTESTKSLKLSKSGKTESTKSLKSGNTESTKSLKLSKTGKTESTKSIKSGNTESTKSLKLGKTGKTESTKSIKNTENTNLITTESSDISNSNSTTENALNSDNLSDKESEAKKLQIKFVNSRKSIWDINSINAQSTNFVDVVLDSIYFAFNCLDAVDYINATKGTNFVLGIGINVGGPVTAGTLGKEHMQFEVVGEAVKASFAFSSAAEADNIVISADTLKFLKGSEEAQRNLILQKYKRINLLHQKMADTFIVKPSKLLRPPSDSDDQMDEDEEEERNNFEVDDN